MYSCRGQIWKVDGTAHHVIWLPGQKASLIYSRNSALKIVFYPLGTWHHWWTWEFMPREINALWHPPPRQKYSKNEDQSVMEESAGSQDARMPVLAEPQARHLILSETPNLCVFQLPHLPHSRNRQWLVTPGCSLPMNLRFICLLVWLPLGVLQYEKSCRPKVWAVFHSSHELSTVKCPRPGSRRLLIRLPSNQMECFLGYVSVDSADRSPISP